VKAIELIDALKKKLRTNAYREVARKIGLTEAALLNWRKSKLPLSPARIAGAMLKARDSAIRESQFATIRPIVEFFPIELIRNTAPNANYLPKMTPRLLMIGAFIKP
jgi:hypothetical protein